MIERVEYEKSAALHAAAGDAKMLQRVLIALREAQWPISPTRVAWAAAVFRGDTQTTLRSTIPSTRKTSVRRGRVKSRNGWNV